MYEKSVLVFSDPRVLFCVFVGAVFSVLACATRGWIPHPPRKSTSYWEKDRLVWLLLFAVGVLLQARAVE